MLVQNHPADCSFLMAFAVATGAFPCPIWHIHGQSMLLWWVWAETLSGKLVPACYWPAVCTVMFSFYNFDHLLFVACINLWQHVNLPSLPGCFPKICEDLLPLLFKEYSHIAVLHCFWFDRRCSHDDIYCLWSVDFKKPQWLSSPITFSPSTLFPAVCFPHFVFCSWNLSSS